MLLAIKLGQNTPCEYICHRIQQVVSEYQRHNNNAQELLLVIDLKEPVDSDNILKLPYTPEVIDS